MAGLADVPSMAKEVQLQEEEYWLAKCPSHWDHPHNIIE
jgi:hypothetical protein